MTAFDKIVQRLDAMSHGQRLLGQYLLNDSTVLLVSTAKEVSKTVGVSESTVVRFAKELGYRGFPDLKRNLREELGPKLRAAVRMDQTISNVSKGERLVEQLIENDVQLLRAMLKNISHENFRQAVKLILKAKKIFVIGFSSSFALAYFIQFRLIRLGHSVHWIVLTGGTSLAEQLACLKGGDLLIAIGFLSAPRETQTAMDYAKKVGAKILGITDLAATPIAKRADISLLAPRGFRTMVNSMTAPFSLANALMLAVAGAKKKASLKALENLDELLASYPL